MPCTMTFHAMPMHTPCVCVSVRERCSIYIHPFIRPFYNSAISFRSIERSAFLKSKKKSQARKKEETIDESMHMALGKSPLRSVPRGRMRVVSTEKQNKGARTKGRTSPIVWFRLVRALERYVLYCMDYRTPSSATRRGAVYGYI